MSFYSNRALVFFLFYDPVLFPFQLTIFPDPRMLEGYRNCLQEIIKSTHTTLAVYARRSTIDVHEKTSLVFICNKICFFFRIRNCSFKFLTHSVHVFLLETILMRLKVRKKKNACVRDYLKKNLWEIAFFCTAFRGAIIFAQR